MGPAADRAHMVNMVPAKAMTAITTGITGRRRPSYDYGYPGYYGWYGGFYYPGNGIYVYDRYRRPYRWNGNQQRY